MSNDSHREWATRLRLLLDRWLEGEKVNTLADLKNVIVTEQFIEMASRELQVWLREKSYKSVKKYLTMLICMLKLTGKSGMTVNQCHFFRRSILLLRTRLLVSVVIMGK